MRAPCKVSIYVFSCALFFPRFQGHRHKVVEVTKISLQSRKKHQVSSKGLWLPSTSNWEHLPKWFALGLFTGQNLQKLQKGAAPCAHLATTPSKSVTAKESHLHFAFLCCGLTLFAALHVCNSNLFFQCATSHQHHLLSSAMQSGLHSCCSLTTET